MILATGVWDRYARCSACDAFNSETRATFYDPCPSCGKIHERYRDVVVARWCLVWRRWRFRIEWEVRE